MDNKYNYTIDDEVITPRKQPRRPSGGLTSSFNSNNASASLKVPELHHDQEQQQQTKKPKKMDRYYQKVENSNPEVFPDTIKRSYNKVKTNNRPDTLAENQKQKQDINSEWYIDKYHQKIIDHSKPEVFPDTRERLKNRKVDPSTSSDNNKFIDKYSKKLAKEGDDKNHGNRPEVFEETTSSANHYTVHHGSNRWHSDKYAKKVENNNKDSNNSTKNGSEFCEETKLFRNSNSKNKNSPELFEETTTARTLASHSNNYGSDANNQYSKKRASTGDKKDHQPSRQDQQSHYDNKDVTYKEEVMDEEIMTPGAVAVNAVDGSETYRFLGPQHIGAMVSGGVSYCEGEHINPANANSGERSSQELQYHTSPNDVEQNINNVNDHRIVGNNDESLEKNNNKKNRFVLMTILCIIVIVAVIVGVAIPLTNNKSSENHETVTYAPTVSPKIDFVKREQDIISLLVPIVTSNETLFFDQMTPQSLALDWIINEDVVLSSTNDNSTKEQLIQRYVLAVFYYSTTGPDWVIQRDWLSTILSECSWGFVICDGNNSTIIGLEVRLRNKVSGPLPSELSSLHNLQTLVILKNSITSIPNELRELRSSLSTLYFSDNKIGFIDNNNTIPPVVYTLTSLETLRIEESNLKGTIASDITSLVNLRNLGLGGINHHLTGDIPIEFIESPPLNLQRLGLGGEFMELNGNITTILISFGMMLSNIRIIDLGGNNLVSTIPTNIGLFRFNETLVSLLLDQNEIDGTIPKTLSNIKTLKELSLFRNNLVGTVPSELGSLSQLERFNIASNDFVVGSLLPQSICDLRIQPWGDGNITFFGNDCKLACPYDEACCRPCNG